MGPWEIGSIDTRPQQCLRGFEFTHGRAKASSEFVFVAGGAIRQGVIRTVPHILCRVKFRGVGRKVFRMDPGATMEEVLDQLAAMNRTTIPQEDNGATQILKQRLEKLHHFFSSEGALVELDVKCHPFALGRDGHRVKGVDASLFVAHRAVGSLPLRSPSAFKVGNEQKAAFVQKNQVRAKLRGLFLYAANDTVSTAQSRPRRADMSVVRVSDNSSPSCVRDAIGHGGGSEHEILSRLPWQCASTSTIRSGIRRLAPRGVTPGPSAPSAPPKDRRAVREWGERVSQSARTGDRFVANARPTFGLRLPFGQSWPPFCRVALGGWLGVAVALIGSLLLGVS